MQVLRKIQWLLMKAAEKLAEAGRALKAFWLEHVDRMNEDPAYAQAFRYLVEATVRVLRPRMAAAYIADQLITAYLILLGLRGPRIRVVPGVYI